MKILNKDELTKITIEDCYKYNANGFNIIINDGNVVSITGDEEEKK